MNKGIILALIAAVCGSFGQLLFKMGTDSFSFSLQGFAVGWKVVLGGILYLAASVLFITALRYGNLSILYPMIATTYIWVTLLSVFWLKEAFPLFKWAGLALILFGVLIIGW